MVTFKDYVCSLKKEGLISIISNYNELATIFNKPTVDATGVNKDMFIDIIINNRKDMLTLFLETLDKEEYKMICNNKIDAKFQKYLIKYNIVDKDGNMFSDTKRSISHLLNNKEIRNKINNIDTIKIIINGLIIAYGVVDLNYCRDILAKNCNFDEIISIMKLKGSDNYRIDNNKIVSKLLKNKGRINRYFNNKKYKKFTIKELKELGNNKYHYNIKEYKKLISILKNNYIFKKKDLMFIDDNIIIPYLYTSINEEDIAKNSLNKKLEEYFEFRKDKIQDRIFKEVDGIRFNFPLWEYRGYSKKEVEKR